MVQEKYNVLYDLCQEGVNKMEEERLTVTVEKAGRILGISRGLAYQMAREGRIPTIRFGKRLVVPKWAIEHLLREPQQAATSQQLDG